MAVALMSLAVIGVLPLVWGNIRGSSFQDELAKARSWVVSAGEFATAQGAGGLPYVACALDAPDRTVEIPYQSAVRTATASSMPTGWNAANLTLTVLFWDGNTFGTTCKSADNLRLQQISLLVVSPDGRATETLDVVKDG